MPGAVAGLMSGQLVGEILDAAEAGQLDKLSRPAFYALLAIAERCHHVTRQGSVSRSRIRAAMHAGNSYRTADRAVRELKDAGLIRVIKHGWKSHGVGHANVYALAVLTPPKTAQAKAMCFRQIRMCFRQNSHVLPPKRDVLPPPRMAMITVSITVLITVSITGGRRASAAPA